MKVEMINANNASQRSFARPLERKQSTNFTGNVISIADEITNALPNKNILSKLRSFEWLKGEFGSILLTAIGTGLVAPIFIGFNPFVRAPKGASKEQKEEVTNTKLYTAMRQPVSAVLAVIFQLGALKPIDNFLNKIFNDNQYSKNLSINVDQSALNNKDYLKTVVKDDLKKAGKTKPPIWAGFKEGFGKIIKQRKDFDNQVKTLADEIAEEQLQNVTDIFRETGRIKVGKRSLDNKTIAEFINKQIDDYISDAKKLKIDNNGLAFYSHRADVLIENEKHLKEIFKDIPVEAINNTKDANKLQALYKQTDKILKDALSKENNPDIQKIIEEILNRPDDIRASRVKRTFNRIENIKKACDNLYNPNNYLKSLSLRNSKLDKIITELLLLKIEDPSKADINKIQKTITNVINTCHIPQNEKLLYSIVHDTNTFDANAERLTDKIYKDTVKLYKKFIENNYKAPNQIIKILIGVGITLPITCNALNWVYPRFMELVFPRLAGVKKDGGDKE